MVEKVVVMNCHVQQKVKVDGHHAVSNANLSFVIRRLC